MSQRELARRLVGSADADAIENKRRKVVDWANGHHRPNAENDAEIAAVLGVEPGYIRGHDSPARAEVVAVMREELRQHREELAALRSEQSELRELPARVAKLEAQLSRSARRRAAGEGQ